MADYPSRDYTILSTQRLSGGNVAERTDGGALRVRSMYAAPKRAWTIEHTMTKAQSVEIENHYMTHQGVSFSFADVFRDTAHVVAYVGDIDISYAGSDVIHITLTLEEV